MLNGRFHPKQVKGALLLAGTLLGLGALSAVTLVYRETSRAIAEAERDVVADSEIAFAKVSRRLGRGPNTQGGGVPAGASAAPFESIRSPAVYSDAVVFEGRFYLAGPSGVSVYSDGRLLARYRVGQDLPAAPVVQLASGLLRDAAGPVLYVATAGEGLLVVQGGRESAAFEQVRADEAAYRDLTAVLPLRTGRVLVGTEQRGLLLYDGKRLSPFHKEVSDQYVTALAGDQASLWIGTLGEGVLHWSGGSLNTFGEAEGLPDRQVLSLAVEGETAYVGTPLGVAEFRSGRYYRTLADGFFAKALLVAGGTLRVGTLDEGIVEVPLGTVRGRGARPRQVAGGSQLENVEGLFDAGGESYAVARIGARDGLYVREQGGGGWRAAFDREEAPLSDGNISALKFDSKGRLWVGYFDRGLDIVDLATDQTTHVENQFVFCVNRIAHDAERRLTVVATANGLVKFDDAGRQQQVLRREDGLLSNHVTDVVLGKGSMTLATPAGLTFLGKGGARSLYAFHGLVNNHVYALGVSGERVLAGTLGGMSIVESEVVRESYTTANSALGHNWITAIVPDGQEWLVGTYGAGVLRLDSSGEWHELPDATAAFEVNPNAMVASDTRVYAGTLDRGLYVYDRATDRWTAVEEGLPSTNVTALALNGVYLYIGTDNGLVRVSEERLTSP